MMFVFAYLGTFTSPPGWPIRLMHVSEAVFVALAAGCIVMAATRWSRGTGLRRGLIAAVGGVSASFALIMPFELAPFFFGARGETMLGTIVLNLAYVPVAAGLIVAFGKSMQPPRDRNAQ